MARELDPERLEQVSTLDIHRVRSTWLCGEGLPEKDELREGIERKIEVDTGHTKRVISFTPGDPDNPYNWSSVSSAPHRLLDEAWF